jgi:signal transduction histidine kinase
MLLRILIIDDSPEDRELYRRLLDRIALDYRMLEAETGAAGLALCRAEAPDCLLLDYHLPDFDGLEVLAMLAGADGQVSVPVIMLTGGGSETLVAEAMKAGAADYIPKNAVSATSLNRAITNALEKHKLRAAITDQHRILAETNQELRRKNVEIQQFYHMVSHELKTPLTTAREFVAIVLDGLAGPLTDTQREYLGYAKESCDQMTLGLNDLLDAARLDTGKLRLTLHPVSIATVVLRAVASFAPQAHAKEIRLHQVLASGLPEVLIDERRITQVLANLLSNALKFTPTGGEVAVRVTSEPQPSARVLIAVSDTGRGIAPDHLEYIFDRLYQVRSDDAAIEGGLGLGLHVCREVIRLHGGDIWVESTPDQGSTFYFTVPTPSCGCDTPATSTHQEETV